MSDVDSQGDSDIEKLDGELAQLEEDAVDLDPKQDLQKRLDGFKETKTLTDVKTFVDNNSLSDTVAESFQIISVPVAASVLNGVMLTILQKAAAQDGPKANCCRRKS